LRLTRTTLNVRTHSNPAPLTMTRATHLLRHLAHGAAALRRGDRVVLASVPHVPSCPRRVARQSRAEKAGTYWGHGLTAPDKRTQVV